MILRMISGGWSVNRISVCDRIVKRRESRDLKESRSITFNYQTYDGQPNKWMNPIDLVKVAKTTISYLQLCLIYQLQFKKLHSIQTLQLKSFNSKIQQPRDTTLH
eukprot:Selendium_serpulae@DN7907_c0_g1_i1.p1